MIFGRNDDRNERMGIWRGVGYFICKGTTRLFNFCIEPKSVEVILNRLNPAMVA